VDTVRPQRKRAIHEHLEKRSGDGKVETSLRYTAGE